MANVALSELSELTSLAAADLLLVTDDSEAGAEQSKYIQVSTLRDYLLESGTYLRPQIVYKDADEVYVNGGFYDVAGKYGEWSSQLTVQLSGASASTWYYLYADNSEITSGTALTANEFAFSSTAPAWSNSYRGYYNGSDRAIFAVLTDANGDIREFFHCGDYVQFANQITSQSLTDIDTTWTDVTLSIPAMCNRAGVTFYSYHNGGSESLLYYRTNGQTGTTGQFVSVTNASVDKQVNFVTVFTDSNRKIEIKHDKSSSNRAAVYTNGFYLPAGM